MPPIKHALLGASSAARWIACTPSARATEHLPEETSKYAEEGTRAHEVCESWLRTNLERWTLLHRGSLHMTGGYVGDYEDEVPPEMCKAANQYVDFVHLQWGLYIHQPEVFIEQEVDVSQWVPGGFGTCDCLLIGDGILHIIDFKYGQGVPVNPERNPQLMYYALGAYALFEGIEEVSTVRLSIVQPRMQEEPQTWVVSLADLLTWAREVLHPAAEMAWKGKGEFCTGPHCRFCKAHPACRAWKDKYGPLAGFEPYPEPATLSDEELGEWLQKLEGLAAYARDLEEYAQQALMEGRTLPGWKLVQGRSTRKWTDQDAAFRQMQADGIDEAMLYTRTPITLTVAEKMIGKKRFAETMSAFITRAPGAPKLAQASDPRPAYDRLEGFKPEED